MPKPYVKLNDPHGPAKKKAAKPSPKRRAHRVRGPPEDRRPLEYRLAQLTPEQRRGQELISYDDLLLLYGIRYGRKQLTRLIELKQFPQPVKLGERRIAFVREEVEAWVEARKAARTA